MIAHIVLFEPKPGTPGERRRAFVAALRDTVKAIPEVQRARIGKMASLFFGESTPKEGRTTYSFGAVIEFATREALQKYLGHPAHDVFRAQFWELCETTLIADVDLVDVLSNDADLLVE